MIKMVGTKAAGIDGAVGVAELLASGEIDLDGLDLETFLGEQDAGASRARCGAAIVEAQWNLRVVATQVNLSQGGVSLRAAGRRG